MRPTALAGLLLAACATTASPSPDRVLIFGEQHDQPDQQRQVAVAVKELAAQGQLAAVVLEMAEAPHNTAALPRDAGEAQTRDALQWKGWPWDSYSAVVMNAVRAGVPVWGGNLPRATLPQVMADAALDKLIDNAARAHIADAVRTGHCNLLPASQEPGMVRIQIARDRSMAEVVAAALRAAPQGSTVLLLTGAQHASRDRGVPLHLQASHALPVTQLRVVMFGDDSLSADEQRPAAFTAQADHCENLRKSLAVPKAASAAAR